LAIAQRQRPADVTAEAIAAGLRECIAAGVTTIGDIATDCAQAYAGNLSVDLTVFAEVIGFSRARAESARAALEERMHDFSRLPPTETLGISPHAPYTVSPDLLRRLVSLAARQYLPVAMHLAESAEELRFLAEGDGPFQELLEERSMWDASVVPRGTRPMDYLQMLAAAPRALVIHGNYLDAEERSFLAQHCDHMSLVYCPRTHAYFGHAPYPLDELLTSGARVVLGTDSRASNPDLNLLAEMRHVAKAHPRIAPSTILRMGTLDGVEALGRADESGSLTPGKLANLMAVPLSAAGSPENLLAGLLTSDAQPCGTWIRGERLGAKPQAELDL
jgi:cytosine/adenosine deaminase-related metal-dependent hydrolase